VCERSVCEEVYERERGRERRERERERERRCGSAHASRSWEAGLNEGSQMRAHFKRLGLSEWVVACPCVSLMYTHLFINAYVLVVMCVCHAHVVCVLCDLLGFVGFITSPFSVFRPFPSRAGQVKAAGRERVSVQEGASEPYQPEHSEKEKRRGEKKRRGEEERRRGAQEKRELR